MHDPTLEAEMSPPVSGRHGKTTIDDVSLRGTHLENVPANDSLSNPDIENKNFPRNDSLSNPDIENKNFPRNDSLSNPDIENKNFPRNDSLSTSIVETKGQVLAKKLQQRIQYSPEFSSDMIEFFSNREKTRIIYDTFIWKNGEVGTKERQVPNAPPMFSEFGRNIGVSEKTLKKWCMEHAEFKEAYDICSSIVKEFIVENGLSGMYPGQFAIFAGKNLTDMKDVQHNRNLNTNMKDVLDAIEKGTIQDADI